MRNTPSRAQRKMEIASAAIVQLGDAQAVLSRNMTELAATQVELSSGVQEARDYVSESMQMVMNTLDLFDARIRRLEKAAGLPEFDDVGTPE